MSQEDSDSIELETEATSKKNAKKQSNKNKKKTDTKTTKTKLKKKREEEEEEEEKEEKGKELQAEEKDDSSDDNECPTELYSCAEQLKDKITTLPREKWPKTRQQLVDVANIEYSFGWHPPFLLIFLKHHELFAVSRDGVVTWDLSKINSFPFDGIADKIKEALQKNCKKGTYPTQIDTATLSSVEKLLAWLKTHPDNLKQCTSSNKLVTLVTENSKVRVEVDPETVVEELESQEVITTSKKDDSLIWDERLLLTEKPNKCWKWLGFIVVALLWSYLMMSIFTVH
eukprot:TRINITY_DN5556_c0_g2_i1.p1 TRINITY_DN5556_c0_g2~~TRINITY_DN5556_c0_g2_i1.p1  ORF type:complete len:285 (+),score=71.80 TRINITY_DN5556_c0_g2_i1:83-937(+)